MNNKIINKKKNTIYLILIIVFATTVVFTSCDTCSRKKESKHAISQSGLKEIKKQIKIDINRYEIDLFNVRDEFFLQDIKEVQKKYPLFLEGDLNDIRNQRQLWNYLNDPLIKKIFEYTKKRYPDLNELTLGMREAFSYYKAYFPDEKIPSIYTYVSGLDYELPIKFIDTVLIIALDMYLGPGFKYYDDLGIPRYISSRFRSEYIIPNSFSEISYRHNSNPKSRLTLLDFMIFEGKKLYFVECMMPELHDTVLIGYETSKWNWAVANEGNIWGYFLDNQLLYSKDNKAIVKFINEAPFTTVFVRESPGRLGAWIGWQIVRNYMNENEVTLAELMKEDNYRLILEKSRYKPKK